MPTNFPGNAFAIHILIRRRWIGDHNIWSIKLAQFHCANDRQVAMNQIVCSPFILFLLPYCSWGIPPYRTCCRDRADWSSAVISSARLIEIGYTSRFNIADSRHLQAGKPPACCRKPSFQHFKSIQLGWFKSYRQKDVSGL